MNPRPFISAQKRVEYAKGYIGLGLINEASEELEAIEENARTSVDVLRELQRIREAEAVLLRTEKVSGHESAILHYDLAGFACLLRFTWRHKRLRILLVGCSYQACAL